MTTEIAPETHTLVPTDTPNHPLLARTKEIHSKPKTSTRFFGGLTIGFHSIKFLMKNPKLWSSAIIPAIINITLFLITTTLLFYYSGPIIDGIWAKPDAWYVLIVWWIFRILIYPLFLVFAYFFTLILGTVIAAPFLTTLSEKTESIFVGYPVKGANDIATNVRGALTALVYVAGYLLFMIPIFFFTLVPFVGFIGTIAGGFVSAFFLALEYNDYVLDRRAYTLREKFRIIWDEKPLTLGFGLGTSFLLWIPMVNFLTMPIAVIGGTAIAISIDENTKRNTQ